VISERSQQVTKVFAAHAISADGYTTGPDPGPAQPLGVGGQQLFDWYSDGDTPVPDWPSFRLSAESAAVFEALAGRVGAVIAGRKTYDDSNGWGGGGPHPTAPLFVLTNDAPADPAGEEQTFVTAGIEEAIEQAGSVASAAGKDVGLMGSGVINAALEADLLDEFTIHQVPILLGGGTPFFRDLPAKVQLRLVSVTEAPGVTHLTYAVRK
jgi:dihydrofolate reductase